MNAVKMIERDERVEVPSASERKALLTYLTDAVLVMAAAGTDVDEQDPARGAVVPVGLVTNGSLIWPMEVRYYYENYGGAIDAELLADARRHGFIIPDVSPERVTEVLDFVRSHLSTSAADERPDLRGDAADPFQ
jgi:hypothetical protein